MKVFNWLISWILPWKFVGFKGANSYYEHRRTKQRLYFLDDIRGYTPVDNDWINHKKNNLLD